MSAESIPSNAAAISARLRELGLRLPAAPAPAGNYLPWRISGRQLFLSGVLPLADGQLTHAGAVGADRSVEDGHAAARACALNALANIEAALGSLDRVRQFLLVTGFVQAVPGFAESPRVINGASDLFAEVFGEAGKSARAAVGVSGLPKNATVEIQVTVEFD
jgi:enamine deaminase RidA (YjgF/YER057c/UK114 family)